MSSHNTLGSSPSSLNLLSTAETNGLGTIASDTADTAPFNSSRSTLPTASTVTSGQIHHVPAANISSDTSIWKQSAHPVALFCLYLFRSLAIATYILCGFFSDSYVFSTVIVVVLLSADFWTVRNVSGRVLVGLRFWNQVDEDGTSYWVFESRDPSQPSNAVDSKLFWTALYAYPAAWVFLFFIGLLKFNLSFLPIILLALVFNLTNTVGFTYADRDAKRKWASGMRSSASGLFGQFGGSFVTGLAKAGMGKMFG
ncbi:hypothetical protein CROQUDRAFT_656341 [Cronartium quercuum f. sp. fusiforme G11]|uniref:Golgi apparatus membrane protein TVP23 n=1 Tax=Cronartium quercuum f. sp. fusiforme G11 TaxID=708437 RepID=A0A9P6NPG0_9BASI|nr:hypothetical protein CROQUDRAFT_656341 [Cronartium quercuum f. sp. fusiforme G11]